ncbi:Altered inheritance of mitochondria protein 41 like [Verticillium longisporum]|uniref:Altered inheritance of mitochondria protein 41 n=1 Tax=Verticillium longisporum TaxID=100787 RepID=A0A8I2ZA90_VERLO|nr:Altered inheritance of mitochondria protein 41 like [Verticillium longisporum]KAG7125786.1 Altered inheritance of mitochondria protein 41 like [Verticillium longisporum]KAG7137198.1 Altered inheritance of mitochondria protein 41 like [Verticillium longisporum]
MAARFPLRWAQALRPIRLQPARRSYHVTAPLRSAADAAPSTPPFLATLKADLKTAMRAKDAQRLAVLRAIITTTNNAAKTDSPIATDAQLIALLRRNMRANLDAAEQARAAQREDLAEKEEAQAKVLQDYIENSGVKQVTEAEVVELISRTIDEVKAASANGKSSLGAVMKGVQGALKGRALEVEMARVSELVKEAINKA